MAKYRKKPVVVEAVQFDDDAETMSIIQDFTGINPLRVDYAQPDNPQLIIPTLEGLMRANIGDWIIKGVKGECYPCKPDIFEATYDLVEGES